MKLLKLVLREVLSTLLWMLTLPFKSVTHTVTNKKREAIEQEKFFDDLHEYRKATGDSLVDPASPWAH